MQFKKSLQNRKFVVTLEIQPSIETGIEELIRKIVPIRGRIDALAVPELKAEGVTMDTLGACRALKDQQFEPILETTCREKSRIDIQERLIKASEAGIENILAFTEDYRISGESLQEMMFFHVDSAKLFSVVDNLKEGHDITGRGLQVRPTFCFGMGVDSSWGKDVPDLELKEMEEVARRGIHYFLSTPVFDLDSFDQFMNRVRPIGIPVIAEIAIVQSTEMGHFLNRHVKPETVPVDVIERIEKSPDREETSIGMVTELVEGLRDLCQGIHLIPMGAEDRIPRYLDALKI
jgi:methylenetetrahydrofolate reductase (NADPH)